MSVPGAFGQARLRGHAPTAVVNVLVWWGLLFLLYVIFISAVTALELMVGAGFALLGAVAADAVRRAEHPQVHGGRRIAAAAAAFPLTLLRETGQLAAAVTRALRGRGTPGSYVTIQLPPESDPALAAALLSASPNACVIDIEDRFLTAHVLVGTTSSVERALGGRRLG